MRKTEWLEKRMQYIRGLKSPNEQQRLMLTLAERGELTAKEQRTLALLVRAERTTERALKAEAGVARLLTAEQQAQRKKRNHELYKSAGLMSLAGVVDKVTGKPVVDKGLLVGVLNALKNNALEGSDRFKFIGDEIINTRDDEKTP